MVQRASLPLEHGAIAGADGQRSNLNHRIRAGLENHAHHPQGDGDAFQHQALIQLPVQLPSAQGIRKGGQFAHPIDRTGQLGGIKLQPGHQGWSQAFC